MTRDKIIQLAFIKLGEVHNRYNDNTSDQYRIASFLLDDIIENLAVDTTFLFNATTVELAKTIEERDELGRYRFHIPADFLNIIRSNVNIDREGEYFLSTFGKIILTYCKDIEFIEYPKYLEKLLVAKLMVELAKVYSTYSGSIGFATGMEISSIQEIMNLEGLANGGVDFYELV